MIHFTNEGGFKKIGLNLYRAPGGFVAAWLWYDVANRELYGWRFRLRMHIKPRILWSIERSNVIKNYLMVNDLDLVQRETLVDLTELEDRQKRINEPMAYVKPVRDPDVRA